MDFRLAIYIEFICVENEIYPAIGSRSLKHRLSKLGLHASIYKSSII